MENIKQRIEFLRETLHHQNYNYYVLNSPSISDIEFDQLLHELEALEKEYPQYADTTSPTQRVGNDSQSAFVQIDHLYPMLSLNNTYSDEEIKEFDGRIRKEITSDLGFFYDCELKFDGVAISLIYENGKLLRAVTRGDGTRGDDVTQNVKTIRSIPLALQGSGYPTLFEVRGEIYMPLESFNKTNALREEAGETLFANPRNATAGTLKQQNSRIVAQRKLDCFVYAVYADRLPFDSHYQSLQMLHRWGFKISKATQRLESIEQVLQFIHLWEHKRHRLPYATDGVVIKVDAYNLQTVLGFTSKAPKWAVAYKFKAERVITRLESIDYQVGRTGAVTPVANLQPVQLAGTVVKRASLHNAEQIAVLDIRLGDQVYIEKGGEIIPKITGVDHSQRDLFATPIQYITHCPACGTLLIREESEAKHYCPNTWHCPPQIIGRIVHFISRKAMNIDGLGSETVELLFNEGLIRNMAELYNLTPQQLSPLERLGDKSAQRIIESLKESRHVPFERVLFAIGIRYVGETTAKKIAQQIGSIDALKEASMETLLQIDEVGERIAKSILQFFATPENEIIIERLKNAGLNFVSEQKLLHSDRLKDKAIVVSGVFSLNSRDRYKEMITENGGKVVSSISSKTSFVLAGTNMGPAKLEKAKKLEVDILTEDEFLTLLQ